MNCETVQPLIGPYRDGALSPPQRQGVGAHLQHCAAGAGLHAAETRLAHLIGEGYEMTAPDGLAQRIKAALDDEDSRANQEVSASVAPTAAAPPSQRRSGIPTWAQAAALVFACAVSAVGGWQAAAIHQRADQVQRDVLQAHVRSLLQDNPLQVASSDSHTVRPWFAGRIDIAPGVRDLTGEGFPLIGGRLDYVGERRVGVVVYKRKQHWVNVYMWPAGDEPDTDATAAARNGYNMVSWTKGGIAHTAVSDLNLTELHQLQARL